MPFNLKGEVLTLKDYTLGIEYLLDLSSELKKQNT